MSLCFIDIETTGLDPTRHAVWEIAIITEHGEFNWVLHLDEAELAAADPMALTVGQFYRRHTEAATEYYRGLRFVPLGLASDTADKPHWEIMRDNHFVGRGDRPTLADFLVKEIDTSHLVGAVPSFDARFVGDFCRAYNRVPAWHYHLVDVEALAAGKLDWEPPWKSKDLYRALGVNPEYFAEHTALGDARMAEAVYEKVFDLEPTHPDAYKFPAEGDEPEFPRSEANATNVEVDDLSVSEAT